jgi:hypothetical protein
VPVSAESYLQLQHALDPHTKAGHYYERSFIADKASPALAQATLAAFQGSSKYPGVKAVIAFLPLGGGGALTDFMGNGAFSDTQRKGNWYLGVIGSFDPTKGKREDLVAWANEARDAMLPHCTTHYTNSSNNQPGSRVVFSGSLDRLRQVKQTYDPDNVFCNNQNVVPANMDETQCEQAQARD